MAKYIAAISGGPDSMAMLHMYQKQIVAVCHVNYQKRETAGRDMLVVQRFCEQHQIPFEKLIVSKEKYEQYFKKSKNFQNVARLIRYDFFVENADKYQVDQVLVAHNKDDFLETAFLQIKRKSKKLFFGIEQDSKYKKLSIYRPLLHKWKKELLTYCKENNVPYGIDETNETDIYERNRVRKAFDALSLEEKESEHRRIQKINKQHKDKKKLVHKEYELWKVACFDIGFYRKKPKWMYEQLIYYFLIDNNINKISSNKIKLIDQFLQLGKTKGKLRLGNDKWLQKIDNILVVKKEKK